MGFNPIEGLLYAALKTIRFFDKRDRDVLRFNPDAVKKILVVSSTALGDTLLSTPAVRAVRRRYPKSLIIACFNKDNMELFSNNPHIDGVIAFHGGYKKFWSAVKELKKFKFDLALILHGNEPQATPLCYLSGARFIFKLPNDSRYNFLLSNRTPVLGWVDLGHGIEARLKTAALAGCKAIDPRMELFVHAELEEEVDGFLKGEGVIGGAPLIGFQPGASTKSRMWFADRFIELGKRLVKDIPGVRIALTGSPAEKPLCDCIAEGIGPGALCAAGRIDLTGLPSLIKRFSVFVTGDTGPMHIAYTTGTPVVALYAVSDPGRTGPFYSQERHRVIKKDRTCDPCVSKKCEYQKCMEYITVDEVDEAVKELLCLPSNVSIGGRR
ncbi:MAG: glycosyltransferase family 9 protein [Deltaproteobacteria bacterium]|nr:glycosyltransferase family 9 protein [Deltaproteobacteria bacterium]